MRMTCRLIIITTIAIRITIKTTTIIKDRPLFKTMKKEKTPQSKLGVHERR
jgi:hypothetical protein